MRRLFFLVFATADLRLRLGLERWRRRSAEGRGRGEDDQGAEAGRGEGHWPPVLTRGEPQAAGGIDDGLLGPPSAATERRRSPTNGHPLYFYAHEGRNEVKCHNVREFGGLWLVLDGRGDVPS
jgi:hypothetical protein